VENNLTPLHVAASKGQLLIVRALLKAEADVYAVNCHDETALTQACNDGDDNQELIRELTDAAADPNHVSMQSTTPMLILATKGCNCAMKILLEANAYVDVPGELGMTPLHQACAVEHVECVRVLCEAKATIDRPEKELKSRVPKSPLLTASSSGNLEVMRTLLDTLGPGWPVTVEGRRHLALCIILAASCGNGKSTEMLAAYGAPVNALHTDGTSPLGFLVAKDCIESAVKLNRKYNALEACSTTNRKLKQRVRVVLQSAPSLERAKERKTARNKKNREKKEKEQERAAEVEDTSAVIEEEFGEVSLSSLMEETFIELQKHKEDKEETRATSKGPLHPSRYISRVPLSGTDGTQHVVDGDDSDASTSSEDEEGS